MGDIQHVFRIESGVPQCLMASRSIVDLVVCHQFVTRTLPSLVDERSVRTICCQSTGALLHPIQVHRDQTWLLELLATLQLVRSLNDLPIPYHIDSV